MTRRRKYKKPLLSRFTKHWGGFELSSETKKNIFALILFLLGVVGTLSLFNLAGSVGQAIKPQLFSLFGWGAFFFPPFLAVFSLMRLDPTRFRFSVGRYIGIFLLVISGHGILHMFAPIEKGLEIIDRGQGGGYLGWIISYWLRLWIGSVGSFILLAVFLGVGLMMTTNKTPGDILDWLRSLRNADEDGEEDDGDGNEPEADEEKDSEKADEDVVFEKRLLPVLSTRLLDSVKLTGKRTVDLREEAPKTKSTLPPYEPPPLTLLSNITTKPASGDVKKSQLIIQKTLENFGIPVAMAEVNVGPTVTQYTLKPDEGVKLAKLTALHNDLAMALSAHPVRIEAPIPGKNLVGIEVPNKAVAVVRLREMLESKDFQRTDYSLPFSVGKDVTGQCIVADLAKMPHLLVAGATGSGKSVMINDLITSLIYKNGPAVLKFIMIDPKRVELALYNGIPHLLSPVITESDKAIQGLRWAVGEMERRYRVLAEVKKRDIGSYNRGRSGAEIMPFVVVIIDELAEIMVKYGREVEGAIVRLAQMARAVGIHLVVSTQRPSVDVITGLIKANITSRIAFNVASAIDSRTILDGSGAEKLLGNGDMLFQRGDISKPRRLQAPYISEDEVKRVTEFLASNGTPEYDLSITTQQASPNGMSGGFDGDDVDDALINDAITIVRESKKASTSLLQRRLRIGYSRAARIIDVLEQKGIVGPADGAKPREVLDGGDEILSDESLEVEPEIKFEDQTYKDEGDREIV
jgi:S-DNA-T family DNA segregation ATPase FtsK/SpoIIIE